KKYQQFFPGLFDSKRSLPLLSCSSSSPQAWGRPARLLAGDETGLSVMSGGTFASVGGKASRLPLAYPSEASGRKSSPGPSLAPPCVDFGEADTTIGRV